MRSTAVGAKLVVLGAWIAAAAGPFACGGDAFTAAPGDGGPPADSSLDASGDDAVAPDAEPPGDGSGITITGNVVDAYLLPMSGIAVHCQGQTATTQSDGTFSLSGITTPYAITAIVAEAGGHEHAYVFEGATRKSPTLQLLAEQAQATQTTMLTGALYSHAPTSGGIVFADFPAAAPATADPTIAITEGASSYSGALVWSGNPAATVTLYALQWIVVDGAPSGYIAFASTSQPLAGSATTTWSTPPSSSIPQGSMNVMVTPSTGYSALDIGVFFRPPGSGVAAALQHGITNGGSTSTAVTPDVPGGTFAACGLQVMNGIDGGPNAPFGYSCKTGLPANGATTLQPPEANTFVSPPSTAAVGTTFAFGATPTAVNTVIFAPTSSTGPTGDLLVIVTTDAQVQIPDLGALGVAFMQGQVVTAEVYAVAPYLGIDTALGATGYVERLNDLRLDTAPAADGQIAYSGVVTFTAQ